MHIHRAKGDSFEKHAVVSTWDIGRYIKNNLEQLLAASNISITTIYNIGIEQ
jgi:hypothetical protein